MRLVDVKILEMQTKEAFKENPVVMGVLLRWLRKQPTVDAVPVVRCSECKHRDPENHHCDHPAGATIYFPRKDDDFCSYGERKDGDTNAQS